MAQKVSDVLQQARYILGDEQVPYRYTQAELISHTNALVGEVKRVRPDFFDGSQDDDLPILEEDDVLPLDAILFMPAVFYVAGMAELVDDEHVNSGRAAGILAKFYTSISSPGV